MRHWFRGVVRQQVALGGIGDVRRLVDQDVIPRLVLGGLCLVGLIPFLAGLTTCIKRDDDSSITVIPVLHEIAWLKMRRLGN